MTIDTELDEELEPTEPVEDEEQAEELPEGETPAEEDGELVVTIGDEEPEPDEVHTAPQWVKDLRKENRELKKKLKAAPAGTVEPVKLATKPKLSDFEYDTDKYEAAIEAWHESKRTADKAERDAQDAQANQQREWDQRIQGHTKAKGALGVKDYDEAEESVFEQLDQTQQGILIGGAENSALVVYALAKAPKQLKELAAIKDPVRYAFAIAKLETKLKTTKRRPATAPEGTVERSNAGRSIAANAGLEKLRAQADKTGDYSKVLAYKRKMAQSK